jgi:hypothetical protein
MPQLRRKLLNVGLDPLPDSAVCFGMESETIPKTKAKRGEAFPGEFAKLGRMIEDLLENPLIAKEGRKLQKQMEVCRQARRLERDTEESKWDKFWKLMRMLLKNRLEPTLKDVLAETGDEEQDADNRGMVAFLRSVGARI